jgi:hypothetical protein
MDDMDDMDDMDKKWTTWTMFEKICKNKLIFIDMYPQAVLG